MSALLDIRGLRVAFGGLVAVNDVTMSVEPRTILGVIGPNGAGKSTLVNLVTGHIKPSAGSVSVDGQDVTGAKPWVVAARGVARTFQVVKPFRDMTVRDNVAVGAMFVSSSSVAESLRRADQVLERLDMTSWASLHPTELSVAHMKRLELAKALAMRPRLLLLDEVMAGLRPTEVETSVQLIRSLRDDDGMTIVAIEHVMRAIVAISDDVLVLHEGAVLTRGAPDDVLRDERVVTAYLGERYARRKQEGRSSA